MVLSPSWLPATPSGWLDFQAIYGDAVPKLWPKRLYRRGMEAYKDLQAFGESLSLGRLLLEWILRAALPHMDSGGVFLPMWEHGFALSPRATIALRVAELEAAMRIRGTSHDALLKYAFLPAFPGATSVDDVSVCRPNFEELEAEGNTHDHAHARAQFSYHVHSTDEDLDPDLELADRIAAAMEPAVGHISVGRYRDFRWDVENGGWHRACFAE